MRQMRQMRRIPLWVAVLGLAASLPAGVAVASSDEVPSSNLGIATQPEGGRAAPATPGALDEARFQHERKVRAQSGLASDEATVRSRWATYPWTLGMHLSPDEEVAMRGLMARGKSAGDLGHALEIRLGQRFGNVWGESQDTVVGLRDLGDADLVRSLVAGTPLEGHVRIIQVNFSRLDTEAAVDGASQAMRAAGLTVSSSYSDETGTGDVFINLAEATPDPAAERQARSAALGRRVDFTYGNGLGSKPQTAPVGGDWLLRGSVGCSTGYALRFLIDLQTTAGHCWWPFWGDVVHMPFHYHIMSFYNSQYANNSTSDTQLLDPKGPTIGRVQTFNGGTRRVTYQGTSGGWWDVEGGTNSYVCVSGINVTESCGYLARRLINVTDTNGTYLKSLRCADYVAYPGESGGPIFGINLDGTVTAIGIHHGNKVGTAGACITQYSLYSHIQNVVSSTGAAGVRFG
jgi:hypothetical protein